MTDNRTIETPIPNRLASVPPSLRENIERVLRNEKNYNQAVQIKRLKICVDMAYRAGYMDGYRDGHVDAENGHDERITVHLNNAQPERLRGEGESDVR